MQADAALILLGNIVSEVKVKFSCYLLSYALSSCAWYYHQTSFKCPDTIAFHYFSQDLVSTPIVPQEVWEVQLFKHTPSVYGPLKFLTTHFTAIVLLLIESFPCVLIW